MTSYAMNSRSAYSASRPGTVDRTDRAAARRRASPANRRRERLQARLVLAGLVVLGILIGIFLANFANKLASRNQMRDYGRELCYAEYTVQSGDTLWSISVDLAALNPEFTDVRQYLNLLQETNRLYSDYIREGEKLTIPYYMTPAAKAQNGGSLEETIIATYAKYDIIGYDKWSRILGQE